MSDELNSLLTEFESIRSILPDDPIILKARDMARANFFITDEDAEPLQRRYFAKGMCKKIWVDMFNKHFAYKHKNVVCILSEVVELFAVYAHNASINQALEKLD